MPARHSELAAPLPASPMTSAACKTPGSGAEGEEERRESEMKGDSTLFSVLAG